MTEENLKTNKTILENLYKNAQMALVSLDDVIKIAQGGLKQELLNEHDGYENCINDILKTANDLQIEIDGVGSLQKTMVSASIKIKASMDDSDSHIAEMTLKGTIMGITELIKDISEFGHKLDQRVYTQLENLKNLEEEYEKNLKQFL